MPTRYLASIDMVRTHSPFDRSLANESPEYAAAFFLLADCLKDAVNVILNQMKDLQLAIAVTRVYEGERGPVLKEVLEEKVLPLASQEGNRWLASWAFWMLHRKDMAVRALIVRKPYPQYCVKAKESSRRSTLCLKLRNHQIFSPSYS